DTTRSAGTWGFSASTSGDGRRGDPAGACVSTIADAHAATSAAAVRIMLAWTGIDLLRYFRPCIIERSESFAQRHPCAPSSQAAICYIRPPHMTKQMTSEQLPEPTAS